MTYRQRKQRRRRHGGGPRSKFLLGVGVLALVAIIGALSAVGYVLAIAATRLGFAPVLALDVDPVAVETTRANAAANGAVVEAVVLA